MCPVNECLKEVSRPTNLSYNGFAASCLKAAGDEDVFVFEVYRNQAGTKTFLTMQEISEQQKLCLSPHDGTFRTYIPLLHIGFREDKENIELGKVYLTRNKASTKWRSAAPVGRKKKPSAVAAAAAAATSKTPPISQPADDKADEPTAMDEDDNAAATNETETKQAEPETVKKESDAVDGDKTLIRFKYAEQMRLPLAPAGRRGLPGLVTVPPAQKTAVVGATDYLFALKGRSNSKATTSKAKQANEACWQMLQQKMEKNKAVSDAAAEKEAATEALPAEAEAPSEAPAEAPVDPETCE